MYDATIAFLRPILTTHIPRQLATSSTAPKYTLLTYKLPGRLPARQMGKIVYVSFTVQ